MSANQYSRQGHHQGPDVPQVSVQPEGRSVAEVHSQSHTARGVARGERILVHGGYAERDGAHVDVGAGPLEDQFDGSNDDYVGEK